MASTTTISLDKLARLVGTPNRPTLSDVRTDEDFEADPRLIPGSTRRAWERLAEWAPAVDGSAVIICHKGRKLSEGVAAWLRQCGTFAESLEGGFVAWQVGGLPLVPEALLPPRDAQGRTIWVTRARPKVDRIACPWLIRRFVDPHAVFLYVAPSEVMDVAARFGAIPFDIDGEDIAWSHRGELCTFDVMVTELGLSSGPMGRLATIVRAADTARPDLAPEAPGLLAISLGLSRMFAEDLPQLDAGMLVYDALYRWCRDATEKTHSWPPTKPRGNQP